jgi:hypothetical protein
MDDMATLRIRAEQCAKRTCELFAHNMELSGELDRLAQENSKLRSELRSSSSSSAQSSASSVEINRLRVENAALKNANSVLSSKISPDSCQLRFFSPAGDMVAVRSEPHNIAILKTRIPLGELNRYQIGDRVAKAVYYYKGWDIQQNKLHLVPIFFQVSKEAMLRDDPSADVRIIRATLYK